MDCMAFSKLHVLRIMPKPKSVHTSNYSLTNFYETVLHYSSVLFLRITRFCLFLSNENSYNNSKLIIAA